MKVTIILEDTPDGQIQVTELRDPAVNETEQSETAATAVADAMFAVMDQLGEVAD